VTLQALASGKHGDYVIMQWKPEEESLLHVVPLDGKGPVRSFKAPKYFTFHYMNAYESGKGGLSESTMEWQNPRWSPPSTVRCLGPALLYEKPSDIDVLVLCAEDGKQIHIDFAFYDDPDNLNFLLLKNMREGRTPVAKAPLKWALRLQ
jgi:Retinal pigment epithelial membrane protein